MIFNRLNSQTTALVFANYNLFLLVFTLVETSDKFYISETNYFSIVLFYTFFMTREFDIINFYLKKIIQLHCKRCDLLQINFSFNTLFLIYKNQIQFITSPCIIVSYFFRDLYLKNTKCIKDRRSTLNIENKYLKIPYIFYR